MHQTVPIREHSYLTLFFCSCHFEALASAIVALFLSEYIYIFYNKFTNVSISASVNCKVLPHDNRNCLASVDFFTLSATFILPIPYKPELWSQPVSTCSGMIQSIISPWQRLWASMILFFISEKDFLQRCWQHRLLGHSCQCPLCR